MTTSKRTPEEITEELRERIKRGDGPVTELILAALREAADAARQKERDDQKHGRDLVEQIVASQRDTIAMLEKRLEMARQKERRELLEVIEAQQDLLVAHRLGSHSRADKALTRLENARMKAGLDARSRGEGPKP